MISSRLFSPRFASLCQRAAARHCRAILVPSPPFSTHAHTGSASAPREKKGQTAIVARSSPRVPPSLALSPLRCIVRRAARCADESAQRLCRPASETRPRGEGEALKGQCFAQGLSPSQHEPALPTAASAPFSLSLSFFLSLRLALSLSLSPASRPLRRRTVSIDFACHCLGGACRPTP